jgi:TPR repeat protein
MLSRRHVGPRERDEAIEWLRARADSGDVDALAQAAELLEEAGHPDEAIALFKWAAEVGDSEALVQAAGILEKVGQRDDAAQLRRYGLEPGGRIADDWH